MFTQMTFIKLVEVLENISDDEQMNDCNEHEKKYEYH